MQQSYHTSPAKSAYRLKSKVSLSVTDTRLILSYLTRAAAIIDRCSTSSREKNLARLIRLMVRKLSKRLPPESTADS